MVFNSLSYMLFLPVLYLAFYFTADRLRWLVLLAGSYVFYAALGAPYLLAVLLAVTLISYGCAREMALQSGDALRKRWLWTGCFACVAMLALFKYFPYVESGVNGVFGFSSTLSSNVISIGVSYFTFQAISYLADVYLELQEPEQHLGHYALYLAFFPKLLQGPIERGGDLLPQLSKQFRFDYPVVRSGILLFTCGLFKKVVVADRLGIYADQVFNNVHDYAGAQLLVGTYAYALQLYFDFSGYTDMARGTARLFGIELTENFKSPYLATSIADFWRRWHISFSRFILDYIFKPLQMGWRQWGQTGTACALLVAFLVSGIWHGATWGFVVWGLLHGVYLASSTYYRPYQKRLHKWLGVEKSRWLRWWQVMVTFNLVSMAFVFFRARTIYDAVYVLTHLTSGLLGYVKDLLIALCGLQFANLSSLLRPLLMNQPKSQFITAILILLVIAATAALKDRVRFFERPTWARWTFYYMLFGSIAFLGSFSISTHFVYLQF